MSGVSNLSSVPSVCATILTKNSSIHAESDIQHNDNNVTSILFMREAEHRGMLYSGIVLNKRNPTKFEVPHSAAALHLYSHRITR